ncbi:unnamed protein product [Sphagnum compactum]
MTSTILRSQGSCHIHNLLFRNQEFRAGADVFRATLSRNLIPRYSDVGAPCGDGVWHILRCPPMSHVQCYVLQKSTKHYCVARIIVKPTFIGVLVSTYSGL